MIEKELNTNKLNEFLQKQLKNIEEEMEKILSEQISFPHVSINCQMEEIEDSGRKVSNYENL